MGWGKSRQLEANKLKKNNRTTAENNTVAKDATQDNIPALDRPGIRNNSNNNLEFDRNNDHKLGDHNISKESFKQEDYDDNAVKREDIAPFQNDDTLVDDIKRLDQNSNDDYDFDDKDQGIRHDKIKNQEKFSDEASNRNDLNDRLDKRSGKFGRGREDMTMTENDPQSESEQESKDQNDLMNKYAGFANNNHNRDNLNKDKESEGYGSYKDKYADFDNKPKYDDESDQEYIDK